MTKVIYYVTDTGKSPVKDFLDSIQKKDKAKFFRIFQHICEYGLLAVLPHTKRLTGIPLWEIRILGKSNARILYALVIEDTILVLHGFLKKTQKTPEKELTLALNRLKKYRKKA